MSEGAPVQRSQRCETGSCESSGSRRGDFSGHLCILEVSTARMGWGGGGTVDDVGARSRVMRALVVGLIAASVAALGGCVLGEPDTPLDADPVPSPEPPPSAIPTTPPELPEAETITATLGEPAEAGPWRLVVREADLADGRVELEIELANTSGDPLRVMPGDFTLMTADGPHLPSDSEAHDLASVHELLPTDSIVLRGVFEGVSFEDGRSVSLVFVPVEGGPVRIEVEVAGS